MTGGASGIGKATCEAMARLGAQVAVVDLNEEGATAVANEIGALAVGCDVSNEESVNAMVSKVASELGPVDVLFNNAGVATGGGPLDTPVDVWQSQWEINVMAHVYAVRAVLPSMLERESGYILHTASMAGILTTHGNLTYAATKHAVVGMAEWLSITYHDKGIRVSCLAPLGVRTPMLETLMSLSQFTTVLWHCAGEIRGRHGSDFWSVAPSDLFRCADGWVYINIVPAFWDPFVALVGSPDLLIDSRFENNDTRMANRDVLRDLIADAFLELSRTEIDERAATFRVPLGVVRTMDDVLVEEHLHQRGFWETLRMNDSAKVRSPGLPFNYNRRQRPSFELVGIE